MARQSHRRPIRPFPALYVHAAECHPGAKPSALHATASTWNDWLDAADPTVPDAHAFTTFGRALVDLAPGAVIRVVVRVVSATPIERKRYPAARTGSERVDSPSQAYVVVDRTGTRLPTLSVFDPALIDFLGDPVRRDTPIEIEANLLTLPRTSTHGTVRPPTLWIRSARPSVSRFDQMGATAEERESTLRWVRDLARKRRTPFDVALQSSIDHLGVVGLEKQPEIRRMLEGVTHQAFSGGDAGKAFGGVQILLLGPPGVGKQFASDFGALLHANFVKVLASGVTEAGLTGAARQTQAGWDTEPGLMQLANDGMLVIEDIQAMKAALAAALSDTFQSLMTTGKLARGKSGSRERELRICMLMDGNPEAYVSFSARHRGRPRAPRFHEQAPLLGRFDLVIVFPSDRALSASTAKAMLAKIAARKKARDPGLPRKLQLLVAAMHDRHPAVDLSRVATALQAASARLSAYVDAHLETFPEGVYQDIRAAITLVRFTAASARGCDRSVATRADVKSAEDLAWSRVHAIEHLRVLADAAAAKPRNAPDPEWMPRLRAIVKKCGGKTVTVPRVTEVLKAAGLPASRSGVKRDLERLGASKVGFGKYAVPTEAPRAG